MSFARTDCRTVEYPDHFEAVCVGDEKAIPVPDAPSATPVQRGETFQQVVPESQRAVSPSSAVPTVSNTRQPSTNSSSQQAVVNRQGRQQYQKGMDDARAARLQLITNLQQGQVTP
jgi:hypothetical protein